MSTDGFSKGVADAYSQLAEAFSERAPTKAENAFIEQPCMRALLGDVKDLRVLDAGCGPGILAEYLVREGATVTGFDVTPKMIELAKARLRGNAELFVADLAGPLPKLKDESFDKIAASWVLDYIEDWRAVLREMHRLLRPGGAFVFSVNHPTAAFRYYQPASPYGIHRVTAKFAGFGIPPIYVPDYYRGIEAMMSPILESDFQLARVVEPEPIPECKDRWPDIYEEYRVRPCVLFFALRKDA